MHTGYLSLRSAYKAYIILFLFFFFDMDQNLVHEACLPSGPAVEFCILKLLGIQKGEG